MSLLMLHNKGNVLFFLLTKTWVFEDTFGFDRRYVSNLTPNRSYFTV